MSCGTKITGRFGGFFEQEEIAEKLELEGEYNLAQRVKHEDCLSYSELRRAEDALDRQGMERHFDYKERECRCENEEEGY